MDNGSILTETMALKFLAVTALELSLLRSVQIRLLIRDSSGNCELTTLKEPPDTVEEQRKWLFCEGVELKHKNRSVSEALLWGTAARFHVKEDGSISIDQKNEGVLFISGRNKANTLRLHGEVPVYREQEGEFTLGSPSVRLHQANIYGVMPQCGFENLLDQLFAAQAIDIGTA